MSMEQERDLIACENVGKTFQTPTGDHEVVRSFHFTAKENEFIALFGPGQCGKSTIINMLAGLEPVTTGTITVNGNPVLRPGPERGVVFQNISLFPWLTTMGNVEYGLRMAGVPKKERWQRAQKYIDLVGMNTANGAQAQIWNYVSGGNQEWNLVRVDPAFTQISARGNEAHDPEPTPSQRKHQNDLVRKLNNAGKGRAARK